MNEQDDLIAPPGTVASVIVALHPVVIMNIADHWTRVKAQNSKAMDVFGALLGQQKGRNIELCTSFEIKMLETEIVDIDLEFLNTSIAQYKQVYSDFDFLGWYAIGGAPNHLDLKLHKQICTINENPVMLKLSPFGKHSDLPVSIYESVIDIIDGGDVRMLFVELEYTLATDEAERIGVDHIAKHSTSELMTQSVLNDHLNAQYAAISLLNNRIRIIHQYISDMKNKKLPKNNELLREISAFSRRLPVKPSKNFFKEFYTQYNDIMWIAYLGVLLQSSNTLNQYINKFLLMYDKTITRRGRGLI
jgi:COP9 signalosome complex subunit 6